MLANFSVTNYKSFRDEANLSLVAGASAEHRETHLLAPSQPPGAKPLPLLRSAVIYGPNAAGKTNLLSALSAMKTIITQSVPRLDEQLVPPFRFDPACETEPTTFEATFVTDGIRYQYGFAATPREIIREWLYAWPRGRVQMWFERDRDQGGIRYGHRLTGDREVWRRATRSDALLLSTAVNLNSRQLRPVYDWFRKCVRVAGIGGWSYDFSLRCCQDERKDRIVQFLRAADLAIADVRPLEAGEGPKPPTRRSGLNRTIARGVLRLLHDVPDAAGDRELDLAEESFGTQKIFALAGPWLDALENGNVVAFDELHGNLHPALVRFLIDCFHNPALNTNGAQLIFTTHETAVLSQDVFRRDQIWFCERDAAQATTLYPLTDFRPRKGMHSLERAYLGGRYGAVPLIAPDNLIPTESAAAT